MSAPVCSAPKRGHLPNSEESALCPVHGNRTAVPVAVIAAPCLSRPRVVDPRPPLDIVKDIPLGPEDEWIRKALKRCTSIDERERAALERDQDESVYGNITTNVDHNKGLRLMERLVGTPGGEWETIKDEFEAVSALKTQGVIPVAVGTALQALVARRFVGGNYIYKDPIGRERLYRFEQGDYDLFTGSYRRVIGQLHPDDEPMD